MSTIGRATLLAVLVSTLPFACDTKGDGALGSLGESNIERSDEALTQGTIGQSFLDAFKQSLKVDLLDPYYPAAHDGSYGGFVEDRSGTWVPQQDGDKFISEQARLIWTAAKASQFYASNPTQASQYQASATVGFQFLTKMWRDSTNGFGLMVDRNGSNPRNTGKETYIVYGNAFGMYAAAAYYGLTGDANGLNLAISAYNYLNTYFWDSQYGGYYITASDKRKDTNTNVHCLEALIELYNDMPASHALHADVGNRLSTLLARFHDSAMHCPATNDCYAYPTMNQDWTANTTDVSFGHDLELSSLMVQAIVALGQDPLASPYITKIKKVVDFTFSHGGYRSDGGFYYTGNYNNGSVSINDSQLQWWPQAEGLGALCLMRALFPSDASYEPTISKSWGFIDTQVIDHTNHGWVREANDWTIAKGWEWHCNYHNGRALMNCLTWLTATPPPAPTCSDGIQNQGETGVDCGGPCPPCVTSNAVWLEAEAGTFSGSPTFATNTDSAASGGKYIQPTSNNPSSAGPNRASYTFSAAAGTYKVWGRVIAPTADDDSFWVSMDGGSFVMWNSILSSTSWAWDTVHDSNNGGAVMTYTLSQGSHTLVIANREDGVKLDKLYVTAKGDTPSGLGGVCTPTTCSAQGAACGTIGDGCGGTLSCGTCATGQACNASHQCVCAPTTCAAQGAVCGTISDGCGNTLSCGTCPTGQTCNASNQCICTPQTCASLGAVCGSVSDGCGGTLSCGTCPTGQPCTASNQCATACTPPPVVNAGADRTVTLPATVTINGSVTDDCSPAPVLTTTWSKTSGPGTVGFAPANAATTTISFSAAGTYVLRLTASDGALSAYDEVQVTVSATNTAPVVNAGADRTVTLPSTLTIAGTVTDDGLPTPPALTITWSKTSGPGTATFSPANAAITTITFSAAGTYVLRLTASDGALSAYDEVQVTVSNGGGNPCDGLCIGPTNFTMNGSYSSGNLGAGAVCRQTTSVVRGGNCGNFASPRALSVNGTQMTCNGGNWSSIPAARNGGYCISATSGNYAWAYYTLW